MSEERTLDYLEGLNAIYVDNFAWKFYEGGKSIEQVPHGVRLEIVRPPEEKFPSILVTFQVEDERIKLRLSVHEFNLLNDLFKRASFRLEKA